MVTEEKIKKLEDFGGDTARLRELIRMGADESRVRSAFDDAVHLAYDRRRAEAFERLQKTEPCEDSFPRVVELYEQAVEVASMFEGDIDGLRPPRLNLFFDGLPSDLRKAAEAAVAR